MPDGSNYRPSGPGHPAGAWRGTFLALAALCAVAGFVLTDGAAAREAALQAGSELRRLLRAMAGLKALAAAGLVWVVWWRLAVPIGRGRFAVYVVACGAMAAGPGLIWDMAWLKLGALMLHGGLAGTAVALWRDPAMAARLGDAIERRRARLRARTFDDRVRSFGRK